MNEISPPAPPFELHTLRLFCLVAERGGFTAAATRAGLTQSAVTRQIRMLEERLGARLFERTTRRVRLTAAGEFTLREARALLSGAEGLAREVAQRFGEEEAPVRLALAREIGLAYLPGFLVPFRRQFPGSQVQVSHLDGRAVADAVAAGETDVGVYCPPGAKTPAGLAGARRFPDRFVGIAPPGTVRFPGRARPAAPVAPGDFFAAVTAMGIPWIVIGEASTTGSQLRRWLGECGLAIEAATEVDNFDAIVNLVALGAGASWVPQRALPLYLKQRALTRVKLEPTFAREVAVVSRREKNPPPPVRRFLESLPFGGPGGATRSGRTRGPGRECK